MNDDLNDDFAGDLDDDLELDIERLDTDDDALVADDDAPDMATDFGLDAEPGTEGKHAVGAGLSGDIGGNTARSANNPDTYNGPGTHDGGAQTGGGGV
jgi:hypothetical protein